MAQEEWGRIAPELWRIGLLTEADLVPFSAYCHAFARWRGAEDALAVMAKSDPVTGALIVRTSQGTTIQNPLIGTANKALGMMMRIAVEFGMTPASRTRIAAGEPMVKDWTRSPLAQLLDSIEEDEPAEAVS